MHNSIIFFKSVLDKDKNQYYFKICLEKWLYQSEIVFDSTTILRFGQTKIAKENFYAAKKPINIWDTNIDNIIISKLIKTKTNSKYLIGYLDNVIIPLALIMPKISRFVNIFKVKDGDKGKNNKWCLSVEMMRSY